MNIPAHLMYSRSHVWVEVLEDDVIRIGLTDFAQEQLGEVSYVELPTFEQSYVAGEECAVIASADSVFDVYCPVGGEIIDVNHDLDENPVLINADPYGDGWLYQLSPENTVDFDDLLDADAYAEHIEEE